MISPITVATAGWLKSPLSIATDGYLLVAPLPDESIIRRPTSGGVGGGGAKATRARKHADRLLLEQALREDEELLAILAITVHIMMQ